MRVTGIIAVAIVSAPMFRSCLGPDDFKKPWMVHDRKCEQLGCKRGTLDRTGPCSDAARKRAGRARVVPTRGSGGRKLALGNRAGAAGAGLDPPGCGRLVAGSRAGSASRAH